MGKGSTHQIGDVLFKTKHTPRKGWQCFVVVDGHVVHFVERMPSEAMAFDKCKSWVSNTQRAA